MVSITAAKIIKPSRTGHDVKMPMLICSKESPISLAFQKFVKAAQSYKCLLSSKSQWAQSHLLLGMWESDDYYESWTSVFCSLSKTLGRKMNVNFLKIKFNTDFLIQYTDFQYWFCSDASAKSTLLVSWLSYRFNVAQFHFTLKVASLAEWTMICWDKQMFI